MGKWLAIRLLLYGVWILVATLFFPWFFSAIDKAHGSPYCTPENYTVQSGDTLSKIAQRFLGDWSRWPKLAEFNRLENPHLIYPGQMIRLIPRLTPEQLKLVAVQISWKIMEDAFISRHQMRYESFVGDAHVWKFLPLIGNYGKPTYELEEVFSEVLRRSAWVDMINIHKAIVECSQTPEDIMFLTAAVYVESTFRNVKGAAGEIGPLQILPIHGGNLPDPVGNIKRGWELLTQWGYPTDPFIALERYNGAGAHAHKVMRWYQSYLSLYEKQVKEHVT